MKLSKDNIDIGLIAASGQVFRIKEENEGIFTIIHKENVLKAADLGNEYELDCSEEEFDKTWRSYFDMGTDYEKLIAEIDPADTFLKNAAEFSVFTGREVRVWDKTVNDWVSGTIKSADDKSVVLVKDSKENKIAFENIAKAKFTYNK